MIDIYHFCKLNLATLVFENKIGTLLDMFYLPSRWKFSKILIFVDATKFKYVLHCLHFEKVTRGHQVKFLFSHKAQNNRIGVLYKCATLRT